jgi:hypothetical protein
MYCTVQSNSEQRNMTITTVVDPNLDPFWSGRLLGLVRHWIQPFRQNNCAVLGKLVVVTKNILHTSLQTRRCSPTRVTYRFFTVGLGHVSGRIRSYLRISFRSYLRIRIRAISRTVSGAISGSVSGFSPDKDPEPSHARSHWLVLCTLTNIQIHVVYWTKILHT